MTIVFVFSFCCHPRDSLLFRLPWNPSLPRSCRMKSEREIKFVKTYSSSFQLFFRGSVLFDFCFLVCSFSLKNLRISVFQNCTMICLTVGLYPSVLITSCNSSTQKSMSFLPGKNIELFFDDFLFHSIHLPCFLLEPHLVGC